MGAMFRAGEPVIHDWVEYLRSLPSDYIEQEQGVIATANTLVSDDGAVPEIHHGATVVERKSRFVAHVARVANLEQVDRVLRQLKSDAKIAQATHNIMAYRVGGHENRDDDGEGAAGDTLLYLLQRMGITNTVVVVSRWFGGVKLGPDRFRIIAKVAKDLLDALNWQSSSAPLT
eukprot:CRZ02217.1 hypothetical protein [Spongospora subterranea]